VQNGINALCKKAGWPVGMPVFTVEPGGNPDGCYCVCSCLAFGTMVQAGDGSFKSIETYVVGDQVMASGADLSWSSKGVEFSAGTSSSSRQKFAVLVLYANTAIAVTSDHLFLMADRTLKRADRLTTNDVLVSPDGGEVPIQGVHIGDYISGFHHVATSKEDPGDSLDGHLLNTGGVVSADYAVQLFARTTDVAAYSAAAQEDLLIVGSPEYVERFGRSCLEPPTLPEGVESGALRVVNFDTSDQQPNVFIPADATIVQVPDDACRFISDELAAIKALEPRRAFNDPLSQQWTEYLIQLHRVFYPDVVYHLDWTDNTVNAYAWVDNGVRHVAIKGGLVRHASLELEGIALVLAHELAHHYGGIPTFPGGLSCEGQADYHGVLAVMRQVWFAQQYIKTALAGIKQMAAFFGVPDSPKPPGGTAGCQHPPGACRIATYHTAVTFADKPGCAS
jgi:hypothetical protein